LIAVVLAWLTYKFVEQPLRRGGNKSTQAVCLVTLMLTTGFVGYITYANGGFKSRLSDRAAFSDYFENSLPDRKYFKTLNLSENFRVECEFYNAAEYLKGNATNAPVEAIDKSCYQKQNAGSLTLFIWGDSHAQQLYSGLKRKLPNNWEILQVASSGCPASPDESKPSETNYCAQSNWFAMQQIVSTIPDVVLVGQNAGHDPITMQRTYDQLKAVGVKRVIFTGPTPHWNIELPKTIVKSLWIKTPRYTLTGVDHSVIENNRLIKSQIPSGAIFADIISVFCNDDGCITYLGDDIKTGITSWDYGHLTPIASDLLAKKLLVDLVVGQ
jgi:hypothetical protein